MELDQSIVDKYQEPSYRRHSTVVAGCEEDGGMNVINFGEDVLFEKISQSEENVSNNPSYTSSARGKRKSVMFPLTIKDLTVGSQVYTGSIYTYSDLTNSITYRWAGPQVTCYMLFLSFLASNLNLRKVTLAHRQWSWRNTWQSV